ncbi:MAG: glycosyl hydrolase [Bacteroidales bacterium]
MKNILIPIFFFFILLQAHASIQNAIVVTNQVLTINSVGTQDYEISANAELHISVPDVASTGIINITSESGWVFLAGVLPSNAISLYLPKMTVNGQPAANKTNIRVTNYLNGSVIMAHGGAFEALTVYKDENYLGETMKLTPLTFYRKAQLGTFDDAISSIKLKRGYMATLAFNEDGTRFSKVYIADDADVNIPVLPAGLNNQVSFIRVFPWRYTAKKGIGYGAAPAVEKINCNWFYNWGPTTTDNFTNFEFVPMKWNANTVNDANWTDILNLQNATHLLGFNEPDGATQANMSVDKQIGLWPKMLESGLRVGAPAFAGDYTQLYEFIDRCDALNYRVDFVPLHLYFEQTGLQFYNKCKAVYDRTKRPIWITEFNYGGDWTGGKPTDAQVATYISDIIQKFDTARIIERYAVFDFHNETIPYRYVFTLPKTNFIPTPMGLTYGEHVAPMAFKTAVQFFNPYRLIAPTLLTANLDVDKTVKLTWKNDGANTASVTIERTGAGGGTTFYPIGTFPGNIESYTSVVPSYGTYIYRVRTTNTSNVTSPYASVSINVVAFSNIALGKNAIANTVRDTYLGSKAVDGDTATAGSRWVNAVDVMPAVLTIGLKGMYRINELRLFTGYIGYNTPLINFNFDYWDGTAWANLITETANAEPKYRKTFLEATTDSVRLYVNEAEGNIIRLYEIQVMGVKTMDMGINIITDSKMMIYPNLSNGIINILNPQGAKYVSIYDIRGGLVYNTNFCNKIDLSFLSKGMYFIRTDLNQTAKFVIK